ncbi:nucleoside 2-deoxyribosyltransferase [Coleophoma cylindrospora]|uniref:Nucleoside 2-deoxyribosyltransferase n=1 Tax=Coleophoma cylindrospora TaxID=1849047 RepID=A0A3D8R6W7_9HELO|nr:nucleoside 2-deoxyribosyltransferase [Coleophoma cylindrospora]
MKIYLAGPEVFLPDPIGKGRELKALCEKHGVQGLYPMDNELSDAEHGSHAQAAHIREANMNLIRACDAIIANMAPFRGPSMDVGTAYEMGVGAALEKIVIGYSADQRAYKVKVKDFHTLGQTPDGRLRDEQGMSVEDFKSVDGASGHVDNLMIACGVERLCKTAEEAIQVAKELHESRQKST